MMKINKTIFMMIIVTMILAIPAFAAETAV